MDAILRKLDKAEIVMEQGNVNHAQEILYEIIYPFGISDSICAVPSVVEPVHITQALAQLMMCNKISFLLGQIPAREYRQKVNFLYERGMLFAARGQTCRARNGMRRQFAQFHYLLGESMFILTDFKETTPAILRHLFEAVYKTKVNEMTFPNFASLYGLARIMSGLPLDNFKGVQWLRRAAHYHVRNKAEYPEPETWRWHVINADLNMRLAAGLYKLGQHAKAKEALNLAEASVIFLKYHFSMSIREQQFLVLANRILDRVVH